MVSKQFPHRVLSAIRSLFVVTFLAIAAGYLAPATVQAHAATVPALAPHLARTTLEVVNKSGQTICFLYISVSSSGNWGDDVLGLFNSISDGRSQSFTLSSGLYDLRAKNCDGQVISESFDNYLTGSMTWTIQRNRLPETRLTVINNGIEEICYMYIAFSSDRIWGPDQLGRDDTISVGERRTFTLVEGKYDLKAENCDHEAIQINTGNYLQGNMTWTISRSN